MMKLGVYNAHCATKVISPWASADKGRVIVITGPTAVGKSSTAISLAQRVNGEIISADSVQIYKGLDVGSAKITWRERQNIPHHLLDIVHPTDAYTAENFYADAKAATDMVLAKGRVPIVVGGSGLYIRWFLNGKLGSPKPTPEQAAAVDAVVSRLQKASGGWGDAVKYLSRAGDSETARRLARGDWNGLRRALEVIEITYRPQTSLPVPLFRQPDYDFQCYFMYMDRMDLYRRIDRRCEEMLTDLAGQGLMKEAMWLLDLGIMPNTTSPSKAIGYSHAMEFLLACRKSRGVTSVPQFLNFLQDFQRASRTYAERQLTWFRGEDIFRWVDGSSPESAVDVMEQAYHKTSTKGAANAHVHSSLSDSQHRISSLSSKLRPLKTYSARNTIFTKASACAGMLHWIEKTQGGVELLV